MPRGIAKVTWSIGGAAGALLVVLLATLAIPIEQWRTGDQNLTPLTYEPASVELPSPRRLWIDTDAACGYSQRTDPDDCFAIAFLARASEFQIVGLSTVFGNAPLELVDGTVHELTGRLSAELGQSFPVYSGSAQPLAPEKRASQQPAHEALRTALEAGPLTVIALGPLTNLAAVLDARPDLRSRVGRLIAVMGRRPGHIFHPAEGANAGILFGHGPVFRDFNFVMDMRAAEIIVALNLPITLIPYDAARGIEITTGDLDRLGEAGGTWSWLAERARSWLAYWQEDIGRKGFYPFDLLAAAYAVEPQHFGCAQVQAWVGEDPTLFIPFWRPTALLVGQNYGKVGEARVSASALYCSKVSIEFKERLVHRFMAKPQGPRLDEPERLPSRLHDGQEPVQAVRYDLSADLFAAPLDEFSSQPFIDDTLTASA
jgi:inosine-uridine nucleoside N-ribohydrolase